MFSVKQLRQLASTSPAPRRLLSNSVEGGQVVSKEARPGGPCEHQRTEVRQGKMNRMFMFSVN
jgi:hypothetical protein